MSQTVIKSMIPPGGWWVVDRDVRVDGPDFDGLVAALERFRTINGFPVGNPLQDATEAICRRSPAYCKGQSAPEPEKPKGKGLSNTRETLLQRVAGWAKEMFRTLPEAKVPSAEAHRRINICLNCPRRRPWDTCGKCGATIGDTRKMLRMVAPKHEEMGACGELGFDIGTAAMLDRDAIRRGSPRGDVPVDCWMRR